MGAAAFSSNASAQANASANERFYVEVAAGQARLDDSIPVGLQLEIDPPPIVIQVPPNPAVGVVSALFPVSPGLPFADQTDTWQVSAGYRLASRWAIDLGYRDLGDFGSVEVLAPAASVSRRLSVDQWTLGVSYEHPVSATWSLFAEFAASRVGFDVSPAVTQGFFRSLGGSLSEVTERLIPPSGEIGMAIGLGARKQLANGIAIGVSWGRNDVDIAVITSAEISMRWGF